MRVLERETFQLFLGCIATLFVVAILSSDAHASIKSIDCQTAFGEKSFTIDQKTIAFHSNNQEQSRSISSVLEAQTQRTHKGFKKVLYVNGNKHLINIANVHKFDNSEDYLAVTSPKGHKMTYPLSCNQAR
jgi:hypothetical protein